MAISQGPTFKEVYRVDLVSPAMERYELHSIDSLSCSEGKQGEGDLSIGFGLYANDIDVRELIAGDSYGWSVAVSNNFLDRATASKLMPLWFGPVLSARTTYDAYPRIELECESFVHHLARRRLSASALNTVSDFISAPAGTLISSIGGHSLSPSVSMYPAYPYAGRDNFGPWTVAMGSVATGDTIAWQEQSGGNLWDTWYDAMERGDMAIGLSRSGLTAFNYNFYAPYVRDDLSAEVIFSVANGTLKSVIRNVDYSTLANVFQSRGSGKEGSQVVSWRANPESVTRYGIFEDGGTVSSNDNVTAASSEGSLQVKQLGFPRITYDLDVILSDEYVFGYSFGRRDTIAFEHPLFGNEHGMDSQGGSWTYKTGMPFYGVAKTGTVVGWRLGLDNGFPRVGIIAGDVPRNWIHELTQSVGMAGGRTGGGKLSNRGGW
ncbi:MAG: hypothetical protein IPG34_19565 [Rhodocyclaceae bacterium]|nr:hypothetical protein [Rhodocyclaceae bacterium]